MFAEQGVTAKLWGPSMAGNRVIRAYDAISALMGGMDLGIMPEFHEPNFRS